ncbi:hypothetical protein EJ04DRAFT_484737 [Polyplosphaeria fusca]|uniref:Rhodopsin domain-containing protein n=1 Tax=Polyplosphaeria fusca TaxID=682080 RepID=A0A9P4R8R5_9PLEO|nr:hypothetical protein EJ04DRAFT_484737 [Polyplosphaeria fusca]
MTQVFDASFTRELAVQSWTMYGIGMFIIALRTYARFHRARSVRGLAPDDWIMMTAVPIFYTMLIVCLNLIASGGGSNLFPPELYDTFTPLQIQERIKGSKIVIVSEQGMLNVIWCLKACMLFMYARMTTGTKHLQLVKYLAIYVGVGWVAVEIAFFTACRPFSGYWGMPPPNPQCTTLENYAIVQALFNISSDLCMLAIPLPMVMSLKLPLKQKIVLGIVFSMGGFVIVAAILTKVYNLTNVYSTVYMSWYTREASVAVYVANLPGIWPLLREHIRFLRSHASYPSNSGLPRYGNLSSANPSANPTRPVPRASKIQKSVGGVTEDEIELSRPSFAKTNRSRSTNSESEERVVEEGSGWGKGFNLAVQVDKTIEVQRGSWDGAGRQVGKERFGWEVETQAPKVNIHGPDGEVIHK